MKLREAARSREDLSARLLLAARGVEATPDALAGAMIEAETHILISSWMRGRAG